MKLIPNKNAYAQVLSQEYKVCNGTESSFPASIGGHPKVMIGCDYSIHVLGGASGGVLKVKGQQRIGDGDWTDGQTGSLTVKPDGEDRYSFKFHYPHYTGIPTNVIVQHRVIVAQAGASDQITLHDSLINPGDCVPTGSIWKQYFFEGEIPVSIISNAFKSIQTTNPPVGTIGVLFGENNTNKQIVTVSTGRFAIVSRESTNIAQTLVGTVDVDGGVSFGILAEDTFGASSFSSNTYGVISIGSNKIARFHTGTGMGFAVWDCGESGTVPILEETNDNLCTYLPGGWKGSVMFSSGKISLLTLPRSPAYEDCALMVYDMQSSTGIASNEQEITAFFGANRTVFYNPGDVIDGCAAPGGVLYVARTADSSDEASNPRMELILASATSLSRVIVQCSDLDGYPFAIACDTASGVFVFGYLTTDSKIRLRTGKVAAEAVTFGDAIDYMSAETGFPLPYGAALSFGDDRFQVVFQDFVNNVQVPVPIIADGTGIYSYDFLGGFNRIYTLPGNSPIDTILTGNDGQSLIFNYGDNGNVNFPLEGARYLTANQNYDILFTELASGVSLTGEVAEDGKQKYYAIVTDNNATQVSVNLTDFSGDLDLYMRKGNWPTYEEYDEYSDPGSLTLPNTESSCWYIMVDCYADETFTITAMIT